MARQKIWEAKALSDSAGGGPGASWTTLEPRKWSTTDGAELAKLEDHSLLASEWGLREIYTVDFDSAPSAVVAIRLRVIPDASLPKNGPGTAGNGNFVLTRVDLLHGGELAGFVGTQHDHAQPKFDSAFLIDDDAESAWAINVSGKLTPGGKMNAPHEAHLILAEPILAGGNPLQVVLSHERTNGYNVGRFAIDVSPTLPKTLSAEKLMTTLAIGAKNRSAEDKKFLADEFAKNDTERQGAVSAVTAARKELGLGPAVKTMVMRDRKEPRETFIHERGDFLRHDLETGPLRSGFPAVIRSGDFQSPSPAKDTATESRRYDFNRHDLAKWLTAPNHPLTARVTVNRVWMRYFGKGIVETENDFGTQGSYPTYPKMLDWLAQRFVAGGWSMKQLHKRIVTSKTYRQSSTHRSDIVKIDPLNHLLARQNRIRVDAELVRDAALTASGTLTRKIGGPSVMPPQPEGVYAFTQRKVKWTAAEGPERFRRGMYTKFFRSAPYPLLTTFDAPDFQSVCTGRVRSNTPLQSLTMANDEALFELAQKLAGRILAETGLSDEDRVRQAYVLCFARQPDDVELRAVTAFYNLQAKRFAAEAGNAAKVAPDTYPKTFDVATAAGWAAVARALLNTDEFITRE